MSDKAEERI